MKVEKIMKLEGWDAGENGHKVICVVDDTGVCETIVNKKGKTVKVPLIIATMRVKDKGFIKKLEEMCKWNPQVLVSTIHHVKGGEAKNVAIMLDTTRKTKGNVFENIDEELRILYVGVTRAKENLFLIDSKNGEGYDKILEVIKQENGLVW